MKQFTIEIKIFINVLLALFIGSCSSPSNNAKKFIGLQENEVINKIGSPFNNKIIFFTDTTNLLEYQSNLYKLFTKIDIKKGIVIKEMKWKKKHLNTIIWYKEKDSKWIVIDYLEWPENIQY